MDHCANVRIDVLKTFCISDTGHDIMRKGGRAHRGPPKAAIGIICYGRFLSCLCILQFTIRHVKSHDAALRRHVVPSGDPHRPKCVGQECRARRVAAALAFHASPPTFAVGKPVTLAPLGIRRNMSRIGQNPGTTAAGMQCVLICVCNQPTSPPARVWHLDLRLHAHAVVRQVCTTAQAQARHKTWLILLPQFVLGSSARQEEDRGWGQVHGGQQWEPSASNS